MLATSFAFAKHVLPELAERDGHHLERIPVVQNAESRELIGLVSRSDLVNPSRSLFDEEHIYETSETTALSSLKDVFRRR